MDISFGLSRRFIVIPAQSSTSLCDEFWAATFDEIAGLGDYRLQDFQHLLHTGFSVDDFWERFEK
jgi:hypothetical protein